MIAGNQIPAGIGFSTVYPDFDYETYSEAGCVWDAVTQTWEAPAGIAKKDRGLPAVGTRNYVQHPTFEVLSLAYDLKDGRGKRWWRPDPWIPYHSYPRYDERPDLHPVELIEHVRRLEILEAWGSMFEWQVWVFHCVPKLGWPPLPMEQTRCAMAKSRANAYPSALEVVGAILKTAQRKDSAGADLIKTLTRPKNPTIGNPDLRWTPFTAADDFRKFYEYNIQDIRTEEDASSKLEDLSPRELQVWLMDFRINMRGLPIDTETVDSAIIIIEQCEHKHNAELRELTNHAVSKHSEIQKLLTWIKAQGVGAEIKKLDEETLTAMLDDETYPPKVRRALRIRQMLAYSSVKKYYAIRWQTAADGNLYEQYVYYGAHTGLWNGRAAQPANLYKGIFDKPEQAERAIQIVRSRCLELVELEYPEHDALEIVASCLRSMIKAPEGYKLISADFTAIQAVGTSCISNELWRINAFRTHGKIYEEMASQFTGKPLQFYLDYKERTKAHHPDRQTCGKLPILSGDFGAWISGWKRFKADKILGSDENIKAAILKTRALMPNIVNTWGGQTIDRFTHAERKHLFGLEGAAVSAILNPGVCYSSKPGARMGVLFQTYNDTLYCKLPSGGFIRYHAPRLQPTRTPWKAAWEYDMSYEGWNTNLQKGPRGWLRMSLYGGAQMQNCVSHMCREVQVDALMALEANGFPVVMHTHDENVALVRLDETTTRYNAVIRASVPAWAVCEDGQPWPIRIPDAWEAQRYGKWED